MRLATLRSNFSKSLSAEGVNSIFQEVLICYLLQGNCLVSTLLEFAPSLLGNIEILKIFQMFAYRLDRVVGLRSTRRIRQFL